MVFNITLFICHSIYALNRYSFLFNLYNIICVRLLTRIPYNLFIITTYLMPVVVLRVIDELYAVSISYILLYI
ncbi:MAG: hypothetical protein EXX96DRAFT_552360 [Benjaminiella poitrasii]|nr:MAG: hypothetical protein EXX96DRAFT_552360 [Benjaminiella poitrasii]